ncbi:MAG TPA: hypothetical protein VFQ91_06645 [Bryobacteraceae bacterium]|nr:hypothetical protein [Bryobacteraceae bacterium]
MKAYRPLPATGCLLAPCAARVLLLTGQSSARSSALSPAQSAFLAAVSPPGCTVTYSGFPYHTALLADPYDDAPMVAASLRNARQVQRSMTSSSFRTIVAARLAQALAMTRDRLILLTGSCGLELANAAWPLLPAYSAHVQIIALGPTCFGHLRLPSLTVLQGRRDLWSRLLYRGPVHASPDCGHLEYWGSAEVQTLVRSALAA